MSTFQFFACIPHHHKLLIQPTESGFTLPTFQMQQTVFWQMVDHINREIQTLTGLELTTLRCLRTEHHADSDRVVRYYALENHTPDRLPGGCRAINRDELNLLPDAQQPMAKAWFDWRESDLSHAPDWYKPGWFKTAADWIQSQLTRLNLEMVKPIEQLRSWERSAILRATTNRGAVYFKALPPMFAHEPRLAHWLAEQYPGDAPRLLALDVPRRWMLMVDFGGQTLNDIDDISVWEKALFKYGELQVKLMQRTPELVVLKCPDRRLNLLPERVEAMLNHSAEQLSGSITKFTEAEIESLRARLPEFREICAELMRFPILPTLEHGDFWQGQVVVKDGKFAFIDWSDSSVSHPFFSMNFLEEPYNEFPGEQEETRVRLRAAYLKAFTGYLSMERLQQAYALALQLAPLHHALIYHQHILPQMHHKWEMSNMIPFYLKTVIG